MSLKDLFGRYWQQHYHALASLQHPLLVGVSGGIDSVVLVHLLKANAIPFAIAHVNFKLRDTESDRDEAFVRELAQMLDVAIYVQQFDTHTYAMTHKLSIQEAARKLRYDWFADISGISYIATAHHANDNIETAFMYFLRGTGIDGLTGIPAKHKERKLVRPLLPFTRKEIDQYAVENTITYVEDSSNKKNEYTRNLFRNIVLPEIEKVFPQAEKNIQANIQRFGEISDLYKEAVAVRLKKLITAKGEEIHIPVLKWQSQKQLATITWELIKHYGFTAAQVPEVIKLLAADNGSSIKTDTHILFKNRLWMIMAPLYSGAITQILIESQGDYHFEMGKLSLQLHDKIPASLQKINTEYVDARNIKFPLLLRKYKTGDYFYPLGMQKKKKIARFLIDQKLSVSEKEKVWVLESDKKIIAVVGYRIDNRYKVEPPTAKILSITYQNNH